MSQKVKPQDAELAAQTLRDYAYQQGAAESTQNKLLFVVAQLGLETRAPIDA